MRVLLSIDGVLFSRATLIDGLTISQDSTQAISTLQVRLLVRDGGARYNISRYNQAYYAATVHEWQEIRVWDADTSQVLFGGYILKCDRELENKHLFYNIQASDYGLWLDRSLITQTWPGGTLDSTIVTDAIRGTPIQPGNIITQILNMGEFEAKDNRVRDVLEGVCGLSGGEFHVDYAGKLNYYRIGSVVAPFALSDRPNGSTSVGYMMDSYTSDFADAANRVTVLGALDEDGTELRATAEDANSQARYGVLTAAVVQRDLIDIDNAALLAQEQVALRAWPKPTVTASLFEPGLARGMTVTVESLKLSLNQALVLRSLTMEIAAPDRERAVSSGHLLKYTAVLGWRQPDLVYTLRRMQRRTEQPKQAASPILDGSITTDSLAAGLALIQITDGLPPLPDPAFAADAVIFNTQDRKLYRRTGNTWTAYVDADEIEGQLQTEQLAPGSVTTTVLADGSVVTAKIPSGAIQAPQLAASSVTANAVAANAIYAQALQANAVTAQAIAANAVTAGKIAALAVLAGTIAADAVTAGTIAAAAVNTRELVAGAITTEKLDANEIQLGYGANRCGKLTVWNAAGSMVAALGDIGALVSGGQPDTYFGVWAKLAAFGGTGFSDAPIATDGTNLNIKNANLTITGQSQGSVLSTGPSVFDSTYNSLTLKIANSGDSTTSLVSRGLIIYDSTNRKVGSLVRSPSGQGGELNLIGPSGQSGAYILLDGMTGRVRGDGGFQCQGYVGMNTAIQVRIGDNTTRTMTFVGGLLTSITSP